MKKRILLIMLSFILILSGCFSGNDENKEASNSDKNVPKVGGVLNLSSYSPDTMNPLVTQYSSVRDFLYLIYEGLFTVNEDLSVNPVLATDYSVSEGNTVYTVNLAKNVKFHDGSSFDAGDVVATMQYIQNYNSVYADKLSNVKAYNAKGNNTVVITLKAPQANFVNNLDFPVLPQNLNNSSFSVPNSSFTPIGTGRYVYAKNIPYEGAELVLNKEWHGKTKVYIPKVNIRFLRDNDGMLYAFDSGETDIITTERGRWGEFSYTGNYRTGEITTSKYTYIGLNTRNSAFSDVEIRRAVADVIDKKQLVDTVMFSHASEADTPISSKAYFEISDDEQEQNDRKDHIEFLKEKNLSLYLLYNEESQRKKSIAEYIARTLGEAGVEVILTHVDFESYKSRILSGDYHMYIGEINMTTDANVRFMFDTAPEKAVVPQNLTEGESVLDLSEVYENTSAGTNIFSDYTSTELDSIIYSMNTATTENDANIAYKNFVKFYKTNVISIPLFHLNDAIFVNKRIKGKIKTNLTNFYADFGELYIEYEK